MGPLWPKIQIISNPFLVVEASFVGTGCSVEALSLPIFHLDRIHIYIYILASFYCKGFSYDPLK